MNIEVARLRNERIKQVIPETDCEDRSVVLLAA